MIRKANSFELVEYIFDCLTCKKAKGYGIIDCNVIHAKSGSHKRNGIANKMQYLMLASTRIRIEKAVQKV